MDPMAIQGLLIAISPTSLLVILIGVFVGIIIGIVPGIGSGVGLTLLLPVIFNIEPVYGLMLLLALWAADGYGASITSILINVPGGSGAVATCFDGYPMARQGKAGDAIGASMAASMVAGIIGTVALMVIAPPFAKLAVKIGAAEYLVMGLLGMTLIGGLSGKEPIKGLISGVVGLTTSFVGYDLITGFVRFNFGNEYLYDGIELSLALIGVFAISNLVEAGQEGGMVVQLGKMTGSVANGFKEAFKRPVSVLRSSIVGVVLGCIPGIGHTLTALVAYDVEKRSHKHPELFGTGVIEGVIGPEASNNSCQPAALIPTLTLGIPAGATSAVFLGALMMYGISPGSNLFETKGDMVWALMWGIIVASIAYTVVGYLFADFFARFTLVPLEYLVPITLVTCYIGAFSISSSFNNLLVAFFYGALGLVMVALKYPVAPVILGVVLGPILEKNYFRALIISQGDYGIFMATPLAIGLWLVLAFVVLRAPFLGLIRKVTK